MLTVNIEPIRSFVGKKTLDEYFSKAGESLKTVLSGTGAGNDFLGWKTLPFYENNMAIIAGCKEVVEQWRGTVDVVAVVGIGGSYLGAKAIISALQNSFLQYTPGSYPQIVYAGQTMSEDYMAELLGYLRDKSFAIVVISKSGTTTEPAIAFRLLREMLESKVGCKMAKDRIVAITDASKGALKTMSNKEGYKTFVIPDNVGGRYSVLTPVGLLPIALAGFDIAELLGGAREMAERCNVAGTGYDNPAVVYAAARNALYSLGKKIEILVSYNPKLVYMAEWWKQLYGESEGKGGKGIFPASATFSTDLHSLGQYIQDGERTLFETNLLVKNTEPKVEIKADSENLDGLNFLAGRRMEDVNRKAQQGTMLAHTDGGVPNIIVEMERIDERELGGLIYFFEMACAISGYMLGVNPFDQPGVEMYKKNMFALLGKPGYEKENEILSKRLKGN